VRTAAFIVFGGVFAIAGVTASIADDSSDMAKTVSGFYGVYSTFHPSDGIPDAKDRAKYAPFLSPALDDLLKRGNEVEQAFAKANKDSPPLIEGDLFTSNFEGATSFKVDVCKGDAKTARCTVGFVYDDRKDNPKDKPIVWNDTVALVSMPDGWRVDDISYGATWAFGNKGRLSDTVKSAVANATE
jgi:hypothetical protein